MTVNKNIRLFRLILGMTQADFGARLGLDGTAISKIEREHRPVPMDVIQGIERVFGLSASRMFDQDFLRIALDAREERAGEATT